MILKNRDYLLEIMRGSYVYFAWFDSEGKENDSVFLEWHEVRQEKWIEHVSEFTDEILDRFGEALAHRQKNREA